MPLIKLMPATSNIENHAVYATSRCHPDDKSKSRSARNIWCIQQRARTATTSIIRTDDPKGHSNGIRPRHQRPERPAPLRALHGRLPLPLPLLLHVLPRHERRDSVPPDHLEVPQRGAVDHVGGNGLPARPDFLPAALRSPIRHRGPQARHDGRGVLHLRGGAAGRVRALARLALRRARDERRRERRHQLARRYHRR